MNFADRLTWLRVILSPVFFAVYFLPGLFERFFPHFSPNLAVWTIPVLWVVGVVAEITDLFDGMAARKRNEVSDFGKFFDPFADTVMQLTVFLCLVIDGVFPAALYLVVLYREYGILFIRNLMQKKGITMGARMGGKIKTATYIIAGGIAVFYVSLNRLSAAVSLQPAIKTAALVVFCISVVFSVTSFLDYLVVYLKANKTDGK